MIDLKRSKKEIKDDVVDSYEESPYPWGLSISLDDDSLDKLDFDGEVGDEVIIMAKAKITSKNQSESEGSDKHTGMSIQLTEMDIKAADKTTMADRMYKGDK